MGYLTLAYFHLMTVVPAFLIGTYLLLTRKGSPKHKRLGKVYLALMLVTAGISLFMEAVVGPQFLGHFGYIHLLSLLVIVSALRGYFAAKNGNVIGHKFSMIGMYVGGILIAGTLAFMPGRLLHEWLFGI